MDFQLEGRVVIVTGASRGLGRSISEALLNEGAAVLATARSLESLEGVVSIAPDRVRASACDAAQPSSVVRLVDEAIEAFGKLDVVVNNAGVALAGEFADMDQDRWDYSFAVNVMAPVALMRAAGKVFLKQRSGKVINVASLSGIRGKPTLAAYSATKAALLRLTEAIAAEWATSGVQVNAIAPGGFATDAQAKVLASPEILHKRLQKIPMRRLGIPHEIAPLACYLASPLSDFVTGSTFVIDGGELNKL